MLSVATARRLRDLGVRWDPQVGDRFVVVDRGMDEDVFTVSAMTVEVSDQPHGRLIKFHGTTEWALDSVEQGDALWLPREEQLRVLLGGTFRGFSPDAGGGWRIELAVDGQSSSVSDQDAEEAYGLALASLLG